jgi:hypothetical protein
MRVSVARNLVDLIFGRLNVMSDLGGISMVRSDGWTLCVDLVGKTSFAYQP